jgi:hypothetical protein
MELAEEKWSFFFLVSLSPSLLSPSLCDGRGNYFPCINTLAMYSTVRGTRGRQRVPTIYAGGAHVRMVTSTILYADRTREPLMVVAEHDEVQASCPGDGSVGRGK